MKISAGHVFRKPGHKVRLDTIPTQPPKGMTKERARARLDALGAELFTLQDALWGSKLDAVLVVLQGRDGAGKDGAIKNVAGYLNPRGVVVHSFGVPTVEERAHDFLWRVHLRTPARGEVTLFNRSHYEDVLVTRVHELIPKKVWQPRYGHIADFEAVLAEAGTLVLKFFLHISRDEQEKRLTEREQDPRTAWKLNVDDWKERAHWDDYTRAYEDAIERTAAKHAPWIVVPADAKWYRDLVVAEALVEAMRTREKAWHDRLSEMGREGRRAIAAWRKG